MSEPNSLFASIHIAEEDFQRFLRASPQVPRLDTDWSAWWEEREMQGKKTLREADMRAYPFANNAAVLQAWQEMKDTKTFSDYDAEKSLWYFGILFFSENYYEMIPGIAFVKSTEAFTEYHREDFCLIYQHFWADDSIAAYLCAENQGLRLQQAKLRADVPKMHWEYAEACLKQKYKQRR